MPENDDLIKWPRSDVAITRLKQLREEKGMDKSQLASLLFCSRRAMGRYENGNRPIPPELVPKLIDFFQITVSELFPQYISVDGGHSYQLVRMEVEGYRFARMNSGSKLKKIQYNAYGEISDIESGKELISLKMSDENTLNGTQLKEARAELELSQTQFSRILGISRRSLFRYENDEIVIPDEKQRRIIRELKLLNNEKTPRNYTYAPFFPAEKTVPLLPQLVKFPWYGNYSILLTDLRRIRLLQGLSQKMLAYLLGDIALTNQIEDWETGRKEIDAPYRYKLIQVLNVHQTVLFPQLSTFDSGATYIQTTLEYPGLRYLGQADRGPIWPLYRYDRYLMIKHLVFPKKLTTDEYFYMSPDMFDGIPPDEFPQFKSGQLSLYYQKMLENNCGIGADVVKPYNAEDILINREMLLTPSLHFPKVVGYDCQEDSHGFVTCLKLEYENGDRRLLKLKRYLPQRVYIKEKSFYSHLVIPSYCMLGRIFSLPAKNIYGMTWDTQYLVWPEGQTICLDEAYIYSKLMKRNWRARKPIGYFCVLDQYIMIFKENMKTQEMKDSGIQPPGNETA